MFTNDLINQIIIILVWIGLWGIVENIVNKYTPESSHNLRIFIFFGIFVMSIVLVKIRKIYLEAESENDE